MGDGLLDDRLLRRVGGLHLLEILGGVIVFSGSFLSTVAYFEPGAASMTKGVVFVLLGAVIVYSGTRARVTDGGMA